MTDYLIAFLVAFICFGFFRRFLYFQAYRSFTKAEQDFNLRQRKPEGSVTVDQVRKSRARQDDAEDAVWEEVD